MARRRFQEGGAHEVGFGGLLGTAYGYVGTSMYFVLGGVALYALGVTPIVLLLVGLVLLVTAWSYAEASAAMPEASGVASFARRAFGPLTGIRGRLGAAPRLHRRRRHRGGLHHPLPERLLAAAAGPPVLHDLRHRRRRLARAPQRRGPAGVGAPQLAGGRARSRHARAADRRRLPRGAQARRRRRADRLGHCADVGPADLRRTAGGGGLRRARRRLQPRRERPEPGAATCPGRSTSCCRWSLLLGIGLAVVALSAMPVASNVVPVDAATGLTKPVPVVKTGTQGVFALADDPGVKVVVPVQQQDSGHGRSPPRSRPATSTSRVTAR